jgi:hypothetical protein
MKKTLLLPLAFIAIFILMVSAACNLPFGGSKATEEPKVIVVTATPAKNNNVVTKEPTHEVTEDVTAEPTDESTATSEAQAYYVEEFDGDLSNFTYDVFVDGNSSADNATINAEDGVLKFKNNGDFLYTYVYYEPYTYDDVRIDVEAENLATNVNSFILVCRYDPEFGWYEYNINNDGTWRLFYFDNVIAKKYVQLYDGGSTAINMGRDTNTYTMVCQGQEITLYINGVFTHTFEHKDLKRGQIAFGVASYDVTPVLMNVNWLEISQP